jgi:putative spermidine/putrescine transport system ATP-binding protein
VSTGAAGAGAGARVRYVDVAKHYGHVQALQPTSLTIEPSEFFSIIGPSGSGKTTLLGVTAGYISPSAGQILIDEQDVVGVAPFKRNIGMVFQNYSLFPHMTVAENLAFPLRMRGAAGADIRPRVERMLSMVRLGGFGDRRPMQLSGGQQQRIALARAAIYDPLLLLMDEPLSALDKNLREQMQDEIKQFQAVLGTTVLYVTHDQNEAAAMSDRIAIMNEGVVIQIGNARDLYERPRNRFVASFLGEANLFDVTDVGALTSSRRMVTTARGLRFATTGDLPSGERRYACVRPEAIRIGEDDPASDNRLSGVVADLVYTAGSLRYRVRVAEHTIMTVRRAVGENPPGDGDAVTLSWRAADTLLLGDT